ncbi:MAG TPA: MBL fold metallo-hydrolase [Candidatus Eremiobacteraceae bacterium]|nr:MBL fold metallo-hydrolase [Candidatus Eremiobacteraceae bacterium]
MFFRQIFEEGLAQASYIVGCTETETALVVDPRRDIDVYLRIAQENDLKISAVTETHIHADFLSGARELAAATGATLCLSGCGGPEWTYGPSGSSAPVRLLHDGELIEVGRVLVAVRHVPGHTPEHLMFIVTDGAVSSNPMIAMTGDFVFVGDLGRPDLLEKVVGVSGGAERGARSMFASLRSVFSSVPDYVQLWPGHGAGSACGKALGAVPASTAGYERLTAWWAPYVASGDEAGFVRELLDGQPDAPTYFARMKRLNRDGAPLLGKLPEARRLDAAGLAAAVGAGAVVVDSRRKKAFKAGHPIGALAIADESSFSTRAAWFVDPEKPIVLIATPDHVEGLVRALIRVGLDKVAGFVDAGDTSALSAMGTATLDSIDLAAARKRWESGEAVIIDVRNGGEWRHGHIPGAIHTPASTLGAMLDSVPRDKPLLVHCAGGNRSVAASSVLLANGFTRVSDVADGFDGWEAAGYPVDREDEAAKIA